jgi:hypothetical protein
LCICLPAFSMRAARAEGGGHGPCAVGASCLKPAGVLGDEEGVLQCMSSAEHNMGCSWCRLAGLAELLLRSGQPVGASQGKQPRLGGVGACGWQILTWAWLLVCKGTQLLVPLHYGNQEPTVSCRLSRQQWSCSTSHTAGVCASHALLTLSPPAAQAAGGVSGQSLHTRCAGRAGMLPCRADAPWGAVVLPHSAG